MLFLIPPPLHRRILRIAYHVRRGWWRLRKPVVHGCRIIAINDDGHVLLIRQSYGKPVWLLPAGGVKRGEDPRATALRELAEETACGLADLVYLECVSEAVAGADNRVHVVAGRATGTVRADGREVIEARFFAPDALPEPLGTAIPDGLPRWLAMHRDMRSE